MGTFRRLVGVLCAAVFMAGCRSSVDVDFSPQRLVPEPEPDQVDAVLFVLGDAGATDEGRSPVLAQLKKEVEWWSSSLGRDSAVSVAFLGDVVYPDGVHDREHPDFPRDSVRLWNQIDVISGPEARRFSAMGLFLAGNHDWGNMTGERALARALNLRSALDSARVRSNLPVYLHPGVDDPGPVVRDVRDNLRLLFIDTHWWLQERSAELKDRFFQGIEEALETSGDREVIILAHHPWASAGPHGVVASGSRSIGVLYLLSKSGTYVQDVNSPAHGELRSRLRDAFDRAGKVPLVFASGHDHSLQVLEGRGAGDPRHILISGSGSKLTSVEDTVSLRYAAVRPGYMRLVFRQDNSVDLFVSATGEQFLACPESVEERFRCMGQAADSFAVVFSDRLLTPGEASGDSLTVSLQDSIPSSSGSDESDERPAVDVSDQESEGDEENGDPQGGPPAAVPPESIKGVVSDSVVTTPGHSYQAGRIHRLLFGDLNRDVWDVPFKVGVLDLDRVGGSLEPDEESGGRQTLGLKFNGADGREYQFRSIVKDASRSLPRALSSGPVDDAYQDQMAAQFPLGAMVVARLLKAAGLLVAEPRPVIMPDDPRLGEHRERFAGRMGWIEERPNEEEDNRPGFAGSRRITGTLTLYENLREDPSSHVDDEAFLQARLIDFLVGDWDRHYDNWRWAAYEGPDGTLWEPISRDRDWAFARIDGILPWIVRWYYPKYVGFGADYAAIKGLAWSSQNLDRRLLNARGAADFDRVASELQSLLTDEALAEAVSVLPPAYQDRVRERILSELKARRDALPDAAREFYDLLSGWVDVRGTDQPDSVSVELVDEGLRVSLAAGSERRPRYERIFLPEETDEIRIYLYGGDDVVSFPSGTDLPIRLRVVAGDGHDEARIADAEPLLFGRRDRESGNVLLFAEDPMPLDLAGLDEEEVEELTIAGYRPTLVWDTRDWGHEWIPTPTLDYASEFGLHLGATITRRGFGFGNAPYESQLSLTAMGASSPNRLVLEGSYERLLGPRSGWRLEADGRWLTQRLTRFWGFGNETTNLLPQESYETRRSLRDFEVVLRYHPLGSEWSAWAGPRVRRWGRTHVEDPTVFQLFPAPGSEATTLLGGVVGLERDTRDSVDDPRRGSWLRLEAAAYPGVAGSPGSWGSVRLAARRYLAAETVPGRPALHLGIFSETAGADAPYFERASLGGQTTLPGYRTGRFRGDLAVSSLALVRATLLDLQTLGGLAFGGHGLVAGGRVWLAGEDSEALHYATGGGFWIRSGALGKLFSVTFARGDRGFRTYLDLGFPF